MCHITIKFWSACEAAVLLRELYRLKVQQVQFLFPTYLQCHSTWTKRPPFKYTVLTFITDNAGPPRWANTATVFTVTSASVQTILTAQATVIAKSVIKANWNEKIYRRFSEHPDKILPQALTCRSRCTSAKMNLHNIDSLKEKYSRC